MFGLDYVVIIVSFYYYYFDKAPEAEFIYYASFFLLGFSSITITGPLAVCIYCLRFIAKSDLLQSHLLSYYIFYFYAIVFIRFLKWL